VEVVLQTLRGRGHRITMPRRAVIDALSRAEGHPTVEQITADIAERWPGIHLTTVYRTLETLAEVGVVTHVHLASGTAYHLADSAGGMPRTTCTRSAAPATGSSTSPTTCSTTYAGGSTARPASASTRTTWRCPGCAATARNQASRAINSAFIDSIRVE
jgi:hypothetical protein